MRHFFAVWGLCRLNKSDFCGFCCVWGVFQSKKVTFAGVAGILKCFQVEQKVTFAVSVNVLVCFPVEQIDFCGFRLCFDPISKKSKIQTRRSLEFGISRLREYARIPQAGGAKAPPSLGDHLHSLSNALQLLQASSAPAPVVEREAGRR